VKRLKSTITEFSKANSYPVKIESHLVESSTGTDPEKYQRGWLAQN